jgi:tagatose-1,6-bisphosphate aldolase
VTTIGPGTARGLRQLTTAEGRVAAVAIDQRRTLRRLLTAAGAASGAGDLRAFKVAVARVLGDVAPALLVDPEYGLPAVAADAGVPPRLPLMVAIEESGTVAWEGGQLSVPLAGWSALAAREHGACAAKLLVYLRPDHERTADLAVALVRAVRADCRRADVPLVLELLPYRLDGEGEDAYRRAFGGHVVASALLGASLAPDLLKLPWPGPPDGADPEPGALAALAALGVPWALVSAGAPYEAYAARLGRALDEGGACGFIAGRALWQDAVGAPDLEGTLRRGARERLLRLLEELGDRGRPLPVPSVHDAADWFAR